MRIIPGVVFTGPAAVVLLVVSGIRSLISAISGDPSSYPEDPPPPPRPGGWKRVQRISLRLLIGVPGILLYLAGSGLVLMDELQPALGGLAIKIIALALPYWIFFVWDTTRANGPSNYRKHRRWLGVCWLLLPTLEYGYLAFILRYAGIAPVLLNQEVVLPVLAVGIVIGIVIAIGIWKGWSWVDHCARILAVLYALGIGWGMVLAFYTWWVLARKHTALA